MDKIIKAQVDEGRQSDLIDLAVGEDDEAYYEGIIKEIAIQMNSSGTSPQEFARLAANMNIARKELREIRSRRPKKGTKLDSILTKIAEIDQKSTKTVAKSAKLSKKKSTRASPFPFTARKIRAASCLISSSTPSSNFGFTSVLDSALLYFAS